MISFMMVNLFVIATQFMGMIKIGGKENFGDKESCQFTPPSLSEINTD